MNGKTEFLHFQKMAVLPADAPLRVVPRFSACSHAEMLFCTGSDSRFSMHFTGKRLTPESVISVFEKYHGFSCTCSVTAPEFKDPVCRIITGRLPVSAVFTVGGLSRKSAGTRQTFRSGSFSRTFRRMKPSGCRKYIFGGLRL